MRITLSLIISMLTLSLIGCANTSLDSSQKQTEKLKITKGVSKKQDVIKMLGEPTTKEVDADGTERWIYSERTKESAQIMWVRTPVQEQIMKSPNMKVTEEIKGEGTNQVQKVLIIPEDEGKEIIQKTIVKFDGDIFMSITITTESTN